MKKFKVLLVALNSQYIHTNLAVWYLKESLKGIACYEDTTVLEMSVNDGRFSILKKIYEQNAQVVAFSCYIWNIGIIQEIAAQLKIIDTRIKIIFGGPELSYLSKSYIIDKNFTDAVVIGEGEEVFPELIRYFANENERDGDCLFIDKYNIVENLDSINTPYTDEMMEQNKGRIVYFEASRGCPYSCSYCLSSTFEGVRYFSPDRIERDLKFLIEKNAGKIKFVDRTFNANKKNAKHILNFILNEYNKYKRVNSGKELRTTFHFEAAGDLFDEELLSILEGMPKGFIQMEIGVQSTNAKTLEASGRKTDTAKVLENSGRIAANKNIHLHLDLVAGLPYENYESIRKSFNDVYEVKPDMLQFGFLKFLKGTKIRAEKDKHGYKFTESPPYEILENKWLAFKEIIQLKEIANVVDMYYNSGRFRTSLNYIIEKTYKNSPFDFYEDLGKRLKSSETGHQRADINYLYKELKLYYEEVASDAGKTADCKMNELLKFDYLVSNNSGNIPKCLERNIEKGFRQKCFDMLKKPEFIEKYIPWYKGIPAKEIYKKLHFEILNIEKKAIYIFDYSWEKDTVTRSYFYTII